MKLSSNRQRYDYMMSLSEELRSKGAHELSEVVSEASMHVNAFPATEFLGESRIALRRVALDGKGLLQDSEHADLSDILEQLNAAFDRR
jgi:hypothetical protein